MTLPKSSETEKNLKQKEERKGGTVDMEGSFMEETGEDILLDGGEVEVVSSWEWEHRSRGC